MGTRVKRRGREADHLSPSNADVKNVWSFTYPIHFHGVVRKQAEYTSSWRSQKQCNLAFRVYIRVCYSLLVIFLENFTV